jgi:UDP-2,3-diacylglucosamine pyrophosphatase LpxH
MAKSYKVVQPNGQTVYYIDTNFKHICKRMQSGQIQRMTRKEVKEYLEQQEMEAVALEQARNPRKYIYVEVE